jgi:hypothetical protein
LRDELDHLRGLEGGVGVLAERHRAVVLEETRVVVSAERVDGERRECLASRRLVARDGDLRPRERARVRRVRVYDPPDVLALGVDARVHRGLARRVVLAVDEGPLEVRDRQVSGVTSS